MLLHTATEELGHIEMLATAVALNLEKAPTSLQERGAADAVVGAVMGGENPRHVLEGMLHRHVLSTGLAAYPANSDGVPFDMSHIYASGNLAADMYCNVAAESTGRVLAVRLYNAAHDKGMKDMLHFMIARDTMHQQQWLAVIEELGRGRGRAAHSQQLSAAAGRPGTQLRLLRLGRRRIAPAERALDQRSLA